MTRCLIVTAMVMASACTGALAPEAKTTTNSVVTEQTSGNASALNNAKCPQGKGTLVIYSDQVEGDINTNLFYRIRFRNTSCGDVQVVETNALPETLITSIGVGVYTAEIFYLDDSSGEDIQIGATTAAFEIRSGEETEIDLGFPGG